MTALHAWCYAALATGPSMRRAHRHRHTQSPPLAPMPTGAGVQPAIWGPQAQSLPALEDWPRPQKRKPGPGKASLPAAALPGLQVPENKK